MLESGLTGPLENNVHHFAYFKLWRPTLLAFEILLFHLLSGVPDLWPKVLPITVGYSVIPLIAWREDSPRCNFITQLSEVAV